MELFQLKTFLEIAKTGNLTAASSSLHITQPAVSAQLKALEAELGFMLFHRSSRGMELTEKGRSLLVKAKGVFNSVEELKETAETLLDQKSESINLGLNTDSTVLKVPQLLEVSHDERDFPLLNFVQIRSEDLLSDYDQGKIDAGFHYGKYPHRNLETIKLKTVKMLVVLPRAWKPSGDFSISDLRGYPWIWTSKGCPFYQKAEEYFQSQSINPKKIMHIDDEELIGKLVKSEVGCSILAEPIVRGFSSQDLVQLEVPDLTIDLCFCFPKAKLPKTKLKEKSYQSLLRGIKKIWDLSPLA